LNDSKCRSAGDAEDQHSSFHLTDPLKAGVQKWTGDQDDNYERAFSDHDHVETKVKRRNFVELWLDEVAADRYIATHLYGGGIRELMDMQFNHDQIANLLEMSLTDLSFQIEKMEKPQVKMTNFEVYIALIKGYCITVVLFLPGAFAMAGLIAGPLLMLISACITTICVSQLVAVAHFYRSYSYSVCVEKTFGKLGRRILDIMIMLTQFAFSIAQYAFMMSSLKTTFDSTFGFDSDLKIYGFALFCVMTPVAWVRNFAKFSFTFVMGNILILVVILMVMTQSSFQLYDNGIAEGIELVKVDGILPMVGFAIYGFEGIGVVMPIMQQAEHPEMFLKVLTTAIVSLTVIYMIFGSVCYLAYGDQL